MSPDPGTPLSRDARLRQLTDEVRAGARPDLASLLARHPDLAAEIEDLLGSMSTAERDSSRQQPDAVGTVATTSPETQVTPRATSPAEPARAGLPRLPDAGLHLPVTRLLDRPPEDEATPQAIEADLAHCTGLRPGSSAPGPAPEAEPSRTPFGEYQLLAELGRGGMGVVYRARHVRLDRVVALKRIQSGRLASADEVRRFLSEARAAAALDHPGIVPVYDAGEHDGQPYFTMACVDGVDLADRIARGGPLPPRDAAELMRRIAEAVAFAHARGVVHRDLKPANVLLDAEGRPRVTDFGLAKRVADSGVRTATGAVVGTPAYMAPEQAAGNAAQVGPASDVYALGAILYTLLTGRPPWLSASPLDILRRVVEEDPIAPRALDPALPADLENVCLQAMRKDPSARYASADALARDLARFLAGEPVAARPVGWAERAWKWLRRRPAVAALCFALFVVTDLGLGGVIWQWGHAERLLYYHRVALAEREWQVGETERADELLEDCRSMHRGWEWHYLRRLCHPEARVIEVDGYTMNGIVVAPDGKRFAVACANRKVVVLDRATGRREFEAHGTLHDWGGFLADGRSLAVAQSREDPVVVCDASAATPVALPFPGLERARELAVSGDGRRVAAIDERGVVVRELDSGTVFGPLGAAGVQLRLDRTGRRVAWIVFGVVVGHEVESGRALPVPVGAKGFELDLSPDGGRLAWFEAAGGDGEEAAATVLHLWDLDAGRALARRELGAGSWRGLRFAPDGERVGAIRDGRRVQTWDAATGADALATPAVAELVMAFAFVPGTREVLLAGSRVRALSLDAVPITPRVRLTGHERTVWRVAASADGRRLATAGADATIRVWDAVDGHELAVLRGHRHPVTAIAFGPGDATLLSCAGPYGPERESGAGPVVTVWASGSSQGRLEEVKLWRLDGGGEPTDLPGGGGTVLALAFASDGERVAVGREDGTLEAWDLGSGQRRTLFEDGMHAPVELGFSADGRSLASVHPPHYVRWSDAGSGALRWVRAIPGAKLQAIGASPDGGRVAVVHEDGAVTLLSAESGDEVVTLRPGAGAAPPAAVAVSWTETAGQIAPHLVRCSWVRWEREGRMLVTASVADSPAAPRLVGQIRAWDGAELSVLVDRGRDRKILAGVILAALMSFLWSIALASLAAAVWAGVTRRRQGAGWGGVLAETSGHILIAGIAWIGIAWADRRTASVALDANANRFWNVLAWPVGIALGIGLVWLGVRLDAWRKTWQQGRRGAGGP